MAVKVALLEATHLANITALGVEINSGYLVVIHYMVTYRHVLVNYTITSNRIVFRNLLF